MFDSRVGVQHGVTEGGSDMCFGCGWPLTATEMTASSFERGVSCPYCFEHTTEQQKARYRMRQQQFDRQVPPTELDRKLEQAEQTPPTR